MIEPKLQDWASLYQMGIAFVRWKAYKEAIECFKRAQNLKPSPTVASHLGSLLFMNDEESAAEELFNDSLKQFPNSKDIIFNFAGMRVDQGRYHEAKELFERALQLDPNDIPSARGLAYCEEAIKRS